MAADPNSVKRVSGGRLCDQVLKSQLEGDTISIGNTSLPLEMQEGDSAKLLCFCLGSERILLNQTGAGLPLY